MIGEVIDIGMLSEQLRSLLEIDMNDDAMGFG